MAMPRRARWVLAQLGRKPGAEDVLAMLLTARDLPGGGWKQADQRTWRSGEADPDSAWARRARDIRSVTAWRSFENAGTSRWLWCQVTPLASASDAEAALDDLPRRLLKNLRAEVSVVGSRDVDPPALEHSGRVWAHEQETEGPTGRGVTLLVAAAVGRMVTAVAGSSLGAGWTWDSFGIVASLQAERVARTSGSFT
jgi:hypothetical protein